MELNSREIAILVWIAATAIWLLSTPKYRRSLHDLAKHFLKRQIVGVLSALYAYVAVVIWLLYSIRLWDHSQLENTIIWSVTVGVASLFRLNSITDDPHFFRKAVKDNLTLILLIEFVVSFYTFHVAIELVLIPIVVLITAMAALAELKHEHRIVANVLNNVLALAGAGMIIYALWRLGRNLGGFATKDTFRDFYVPPLLSLLLLPFLYLLKLYAVYESVFARLRSIKARNVRTYARWHAVLAFGVDLDFLRRWARSVAIFEPHDREEVRGLIREATELRKRERNPPGVPPAAGWSPYYANKFLTSEGLVPGDYHRTFGGWFASTPYLPIGSGLLPDNLAYYMEGDDVAVKLLKLVLNVNNPKDPRASEQRFLAAARALVRNALGDKNGRALGDQLLSAVDARTCVAGKEITLSRNNWRGGIEGGYSRELYIEQRSEVAGSQGGG